MGGGRETERDSGSVNTRMFIVSEEDQRQMKRSEDRGPIQVVLVIKVLDAPLVM